MSQLSRGAAFKLASPGCDLMQCLQVPAAERIHETAQCVPVRPEPDDDQPRLRHARYHERPSSEEQVDALRDDELPNVAHDTVTARIEFAQCLRRANLKIGRAHV